MIGTAYVNKYQAKADMNSYRWEKKKHYYSFVTDE